MEYHDSEKAKEVATRVEKFIEEEVLPREREALRTGDRISFDELEEYWEMAKERDLFAPQMPEEYGGQGLDFRDMLPSFEQVTSTASRSRTSSWPTTRSENASNSLLTSSSA